MQRYREDFAKTIERSQILVMLPVHVSIYIYFEEYNELTIEQNTACSYPRHSFSASHPKIPARKRREAGMDLTASRWLELRKIRAAGAEGE